MGVSGKGVIFMLAPLIAALLLSAPVPPDVRYCRSMIVTISDSLVREMVYELCLDNEAKKTLNSAREWEGRDNERETRDRGQGGVQ